MNLRNQIKHPNAPKLLIIIWSECWDLNPGSRGPKPRALNQLGHTPKIPLVKSKEYFYFSFFQLKVNYIIYKTSFS